MGGTNMAAQHRAGFNERLGRIHSGGPNTMGKVLIGPGEQIRAKDAKRIQSKILRDAKRKKRRASGSLAGDIIAFPFAFAIGVGAIFAGRVATWQVLTPGGPLAEEITLPAFMASWPLPIFADLAIAAVLALLFAWAFRFTTGLKRLGVILGFAAMMSGEAFLVQAFPDLFEGFYAPSYIAAAATTTLPDIPQIF